MPADPLVALGRELVGESGLVGFRVEDVVPNEGGHFPFGAPPDAIRGLDRSLPYLVIATMDNPTAVQLSPAERRDIQRANRSGDKKYAAYVKDRAELARPRHRLFIATDDPGARNWGKGERRSLHASVLAVALGREAGGYVRANVVMSQEVTGAVSAGSDTGSTSAGSP